MLVYDKTGTVTDILLCGDIDRECDRTKITSSVSLSPARSNDELDILEMESRLRRRSVELRPRFDACNSMGDPLRFAETIALFILPETSNHNGLIHFFTMCPHTKRALYVQCQGTYFGYLRIGYKERRCCVLHRYYLYTPFYGATKTARRKQTMEKRRKICTLTFRNPFINFFFINHI